MLHFMLYEMCGVKEILLRVINLIIGAIEVAPHALQLQNHDQGGLAPYQDFIQMEETSPNLNILAFPPKH